jgi:histidyl-tRNA synthetase
MKYSRVRGTEDILDLTLQNFVIDQISQHLQYYNYSEIQTPIIEKTDLFVRSLGDETDVVTKEMYAFETSGGDKICLRPEATASTTRAYLENRIEQRPWKVFSHGPMFRHERPQKGRWRQFSQINIENINATSISHDVLFISMLDRFFRDTLKLQEFVVKLNFLGCSEDRIKHKEKLSAYLSTIESGLCETCLKRKDTNVLRIFDCKNEACQHFYEKAPKLTDCLCEECNGEWTQLQNQLRVLSVNFIHDPSLVRGLDYYNKTVFEFSSRNLGAQNAFCGGGRYELATQLGARNPIPSIGVGIGLGRLLLLTEEVKEQLPIPQKPFLSAILPLSMEQHNLALLLANKLSSSRIATEVLFESSIGKKMKKANHLGAKFAIVIGEDEQKDGTVSIKNMLTGESETIKQVDLLSYLK